MKWRHRSRIWECASPYVYATVVSALAGSLASWQPKYCAELVPNLMTATLGLASILVGFLATVKSILMAVDERATVKKFKNTAQFGTFLDYIWHALNGSLILAACSALGLFATKEFLESSKPCVVASLVIWTWLLVFCLAAVHRVSRILYTLLKQAAKPGVG